MKIILTAKSNDRDFIKVEIDGFGNKPQEGVTDKSVTELSLKIQEIMMKDYLLIEVKKENAEN